MLPYRRHIAFYLELFVLIIFSILYEYIEQQVVYPIFLYHTLIKNYKEL